jgi:methylated-DNA-[protein]-cysteine S-methyltransferase
MKYAIFDSPIGKLTVSTDGKAITGLHIEGDRYFPAIPPGWEKDSELPILSQAGQELAEYFAGKRRRFDLPITLEGTEFQKQVWRTLAKIPSGKTMSYGEIAATIKRPKAVRAVGSAVGRNKICLLIPCHRVIASDGSLSGFSAGLERKKKLLDLEHRS